MFYASGDIVGIDVATNDFDFAAFYGVAVATGAGVIVAASGVVNVVVLNVAPRKIPLALAIGVAGS